MLDFRAAPHPLDIRFAAKRDVKWQVGLVTEALDDGKLFVDVDSCPYWVEEAESWRYPDKRAGMVDDPEVPVDDFDHCMSNLRYLIANVRTMQRLGKRKPSVPRAADGGRVARPRTGGGPSRVPSGQGWRRGLGAPLGT